MTAINRRATQSDVEIISNKKVGAYHHMVFAAGSMAAYAKPGNFVAISVGGPSSSMILRRAFAIYRASDRGDRLERISEFQQNQLARSWLAVVTVLHHSLVWQKF